MSDKFITIDGAGKKKSGRAAIEAPNTLKSNTKGKLLDLISYGPVKGLVDGDKSIFIDDTPLQNADGSYNFEGISVETTLGTPDQEVIKGFVDISNPREINTELKYGNPTVRTVNNLDADAALVTVRVASLVRTNKDNGDTHPHTIPLNISVRDKDNLEVSSLYREIKGKNTSPFERTYRLELEGEGPFQISVARTNKESDVQVIQDSVSWYLLTEIVDVKQNYPSCVLAGITVNARDFGNSIPSRSYLMYLREIKVPSNYNPLTREYTGIWNGAFKVEWTDNPAWVFYDLATDPVVGVGLEGVNKFALYEIGKYCDELVDDGYGGTEPRFTCNTLINGQEEAIQALNTFASVFRGMAYWGAGSVEPVADMPGPIRKIITPSDVIDGEIVYEGSSLQDRHSVAVVMWNDPEDRYESKPEMVEDSESISLYGWKELNITAVACTSRGQARRLGLWALYSERNETQVVKFKVTVKHHDFRPGDYFKLHNPYRAGARLGGKLTEIISTRVVMLDKVASEVSIGWKVIFETTEGGLFETKIQNIIGNRVSLTTSPSVPLVVGGSFLISDDSVQAQVFRVVTVNEEEGDLFTVIAIEHDPRKYDIVEKGLKVPDTPTSLIPQGQLATPSNITAVTYTYPTGGTLHQAVTVGWSHNDPRVDNFQLEAKGPNDTAFIPVYSGLGLSFDLREAGEGEWRFRVRATSQVWADSPWAESTTFFGNLLAPQLPTELYFSANSFSITVRPSNPSLGVTEYEFWRSLSPLTVSEVEDNAQYLATATYLVDDGLNFNTTYHYYVRAVNIYGVSGWVSGTATTKADIDEILDGLVGNHEKSELGKWFDDEIEKISGVGPGSVTDKLNTVKDQIDTSVDAVIADLNGLDVDLGLLTGNLSELALDVSTVQTDVGSLSQYVDAQLGLVNLDVSNMDERILSLNTQLAEIINAPLHVAGNTYLEGALVKYGDTLYQARQDVPANTPVTNEIYWKVIGDFDSVGEAVSAALVRLDSAETSIDSLTGNVASNTSLLTGLSSSVDSLESRTTSNSTALDSLETEVTEIGGVVETTARYTQSLRSSIRDLENENDRLGLAIRMWDIDAWIHETRETLVSDKLAQAEINLQLGAKVDEAESTIAEIQITIATDKSTQATVNQSVQSSLDDLDSSTSGNSLAIDSVTTRVTATEAGLVSQGTRVTGLESSVTTIENGVASNVASIKAVQDTVASDKLVQAGINESVSAVLEDIGNDVGNALAIEALDVRVEKTEVGLETQASKTTKLQSSVRDLTDREDADLSGVLSGWDNRAKIITSQDTQASFERVQATVTELIYTNLGKNEAEIASVQTAVATDKSTQATVNQSVQSSLQDVSTDLVGVASQISGIDTRVTSLDGRITAQSSQITGITSSVGDLQSEVSQLDTTLTTAIQTEAQRITSLSSKVADDISAAVSTSESTLTTKINTEASRITTVQSNLEGVSASVQSISDTVVGIDGKLTAMGGLKVQVNSKGQKYVAGIGVSIADGDAGIQSDIVMQADNFKLLNTVNGTAVSPFSVVGGVTVIREALIGPSTIGGIQIKDGAITTVKIGNAQITSAKIGNAAIKTANIGVAEVDTLRIKGNAVTVPASAFTGGSITSRADGTWRTIQTLSFYHEGSPSYCQFGMSVEYANTEYPAFVTVAIRCRMVRGGTVLSDCPAVGFPRSNSVGIFNGFSFGVSSSPSVGWHTYHLQVLASQNYSPYYIYRNRSIFVMETKR